MKVRFAAALAVAGLITVSCGGVVDPSKNVTETFSGTLDPQSSKSFTMSVNNGGEFSVKITALAPSATAVVGTAWAFGANCDVLVQSNNFSTLNQPALSGAVLQKGTYCVAIYDIGTLTASQNFTLSVSHP